MPRQRSVKARATANDSCVCEPMQPESRPRRDRLKSGLQSSMKDRLRRAVVQDLTMQERLVLVLRFAERMSEEEIAAVLGTSVAHARAQIEAVVDRLSALSHVSAMPAA